MYPDNDCSVKNPMKKRFHAAALPAVLAAAAIIINTGFVPSISVNAQEAAGQESVDREKHYLLEAMDRLDDMGLSPISIWAKVTKDEKVLDTVKGIGRSAADTVTGVVAEKVSDAGDAVSEKVQEAGDAAAEQAKGAVQEQTEKAKKSFLEKLKEWIRNTLGAGKESGRE